MTDAGGRRTLVLALGANLGHPLAALRHAARALDAVLHDLTVSSVYATPPEGGADQPGYLNAVVAGSTELDARGALALARSLEDERGRERPYPGAPRSLDVDVVLLGPEIIDLPDLRIPHPRWRSRDFVVVPLLEVMPDLVDPETGQRVEEIARSQGWGPWSFPVVAGRGALLELEVA